MKDKLFVAFSYKYRGWYGVHDRKESAQKALSWAKHDFCRKWAGSEVHTHTHIYMNVITDIDRIITF